MLSCKYLVANFLPASLPPWLLYVVIPCALLVPEFGPVFVLNMYTHVLDGGGDLAVSVWAELVAWD